MQDFLIPQGQQAEFVLSLFLCNVIPILNQTFLVNCPTHKLMMRIFGLSTPKTTICCRKTRFITLFHINLWFHLHAVWEFIVGKCMVKYCITKGNILWHNFCYGNSCCIDSKPVCATAYIAFVKTKYLAHLLSFKISLYWLMNEPQLVKMKENSFRKNYDVGEGNFCNSCLRICLTECQHNNTSDLYLQAAESELLVARKVH